MRLPLERVQRLLDPAETPLPADRCTVGRLLKLVDAALQVGHPVLRPGCLTRGVVRYHCLRHAGFQVALAFGIGQVAGTLAGHCWLVLDGQPYLESVDPRPTFAELYRLAPPTMTSEGV